MAKIRRRQASGRLQGGWWVCKREFVLMTGELTRDSTLTDIGRAFCNGISSDVWLSYMGVGLWFGLPLNSSSPPLSSANHTVSCCLVDFRVYYLTHQR
jgi:hypothetical protein